MALVITALFVALAAPANAWRHVAHGENVAAFRSLKEAEFGGYGSEGERPSEHTDIDPPIAAFFKYPGHPNDGNEGNEGNEGDEGAEVPLTPAEEGAKPSEETDIDPPIAAFFKYPGHPNDGNEGNEGNEGGSGGGTVKFAGYLSRAGYDHPNDGNEGNEGNEGRKL